MGFWVRLLIVVSAAFLLAGCGGGGSESDSGAGFGYQPEANTEMTIERIGKAEFIKRVNEICRRAWVVVLDNWDDRSSIDDGKLSDRESFARAVELSLLAGIDFHIFDEIRQLGAPPGQERAIEEIIGPFQIAVELGWKRRWRAYTVPELVAQFKTYNQRARRYGLDDCLVSEARLQPLEGSRAGASPRP